MAQRVEITYVDDLDGSEASGTITFALDGTEYEIDLTDKNAHKLRSALGTYIDAGRKITGPRGKSKSVSKARTDTDPKAVREWAKANGYDVPTRGRVPGGVTDAYKAANA